MATQAMRVETMTRRDALEARINADGDGQDNPCDCAAGLYCGWYATASEKDRDWVDDRYEEHCRA